MSMDKEPLRVGSEHLDLMVMGDEAIHLVVEKHAEASLYLKAEGLSSADLVIDVLEGGQLKLLYGMNVRALIFKCAPMLSVMPDLSLSRVK